MTCRVRPLEVGQDRRIKPCLDSIKALDGEGWAANEERPGELRLLKARKERGRLCV